METGTHAVENTLIKSHDIFARHRMVTGMNTEFKVRLTLKDDNAVYNQSLPMPNHLKEDLISEFALMHKYGIIRLLSDLSLFADVGLTVSGNTCFQFC